MVEARESKKQKIEKALDLDRVPTLLLNVRQAKPLEALELLRNNLPDDPARLAEWRQTARVAAVLGSCPRSLQSFKSGQCPNMHGRAPGFLQRAGLRHWIMYIEVVYGKENADKAAFPPSLEDVLGWSNVFRQSDWRVYLFCFPLRRACLARCFGTFANYLGHLRGACYAIGCDAPPVGHAAIKRALIAIVKRELFSSKTKRFIDKCVPGLVLASCAVPLLLQVMCGQHGVGRAARIRRA